MRAKYETHVKPYIQLIIAWYRNGATDEQVCAKLDIAVSTWHEYKKRYKELGEALKHAHAKEIADVQVENALFKAATGYDYVETTKTTNNTSRQDGGKTSVGRNTAETTITRHVPPNTTAAIFWLKNRMPDVWRDRRINDVTVNNTETEIKMRSVLETLSTDEKLKMLEDLSK